MNVTIQHNLHFPDALATKRPSVLCHALKCIQMIVTGSDRVGEALVPYYRQILPTLNLFKDRNRMYCIDY